MSCHWQPQDSLLWANYSCSRPRSSTNYMSEIKPVVFKGQSEKSGITYLAWQSFTVKENASIHLVLMDRNPFTNKRKLNVPQQDPTHSLTKMCGTDTIGGRKNTKISSWTALWGSMVMKWYSYHFSTATIQLTECGCKLNHTLQRTTSSKLPILEHCLMRHDRIQTSACMDVWNRQRTC